MAFHRLGKSAARFAFGGVLLAVVLSSCGRASSPASVLPSMDSGSNPSSLQSSTLSLNNFAEYIIPTANTRPIDITLGPDGNLWFTEDNARYIGRITSTGKITEFTIPGTAYGITSAPDGRLWFTISDSNYVGRITTTGAVTVLKLPAICGACGPTGTGSTGITVGPDGALWFEASARITGQFQFTRSIIRVTTAGKFSSFRIGDIGGPFLLWSTTGPDGAVWATSHGLSGARWVGFVRLTTTGGFTFYSHSTTSGTGPVDVTVGPDRNLWFTDWLSSTAGDGLRDNIGRLSSTGKIIAEYTIPTPDSFPVKITSAVDGNLWFTESGASKIGRSTTTGSILEYSLPPNREPWGITAGPGRTIWFTELNANKIGRFSV